MRRWKFWGTWQVQLLGIILLCGCWQLGDTAQAADEKPSLTELTNKAEQGDKNAQFELGRIYAQGTDDVPKDDAKALAWFQKAAAAGHTKAEVSLGSIYAHGFGVPQDWQESIRWYRKAAEKGDTTAEHNLGLDYAHGHGVEKDPAIAAEWFRKAAVQGHARAAFNLGELYEAGNGVPQSDLEAYVLYAQAGAHENQEHIFGKVKAAEVIEKRAGTKAKLTAEQLAKAEKRIATAQALAAVHPRKFGAPGLIGRSRGWWVWKSWNPETWEAEVTPDPPGEVIKVQVLPWVTTYQHLAYGGRIDELLPGEKMNMFFDPSAEHRRGYVVHFQDEISQMKGHGHYWKVREVAATDANAAKQFTAQVFAGEKPLEEKVHTFEIDPECKKWKNGEQVDAFPLQAGDQIYMTWIYNDDNQRIVKLLTDGASLEAQKEMETKRIAAEVSREGMAGQLENASAEKVQFMVYSSYWAQSGKLKKGQPVRISATGPGFHPTGKTVPAKVLFTKNRGTYGSGVNDVMLEVSSPADLAALKALPGQVLRLIPGDLE